MQVLEDFPRTELEFHRRFSNEEACREFFMSLRWPEGFVCPHCKGKGGWRRNGREEYVCANRQCGKETSLRAGTVLHNSPKALSEWLLAMLHMTISKQGMSALELQRRMGFGCYRTALRWLRELRRAMGASLASRELLGPEVELDEVSVGGVKERGTREAEGDELAWLVGVVERLPSGCGRTRLKLLSAKNKENICAFVESVVTKGSLISSDGGSWYSNLRERGYYHDPRVTTNSNKQKKSRNGEKMAVAHLPRIHRVFSLVKRLVIGAHQGSYSKVHLQGYLDEYCFRFERKNAPRRPQLARELARCALKTQCVPYWRSSGRPAPDVPTKRQTKTWQEFGKLYRREPVNG